MATAARERRAARRIAARRDGFRNLTMVVAAAAPVALVLVVVILFQEARPAIVHFGPGFLTTTNWNPVRNDFGAAPFIFATLATSAFALLMAVPVGVGVAIFLAEPGLPRVRGFIGTAVELLAAIPSVVYGLWGLVVLAPWVFLHVDKPVSARFGGFFLFNGVPRQTSLFAASLVLAIMVLPTLAAVSRDVLKAVPGGLREASIALGATWSETVWRVVLPAARSGIVGAVVLALGRALGETIAVAMVIGNSPQIHSSIFAPAETLAAVIANEYTDATSPLHSAALVEVGLVLVAVTLIVNVAALLLVHNSTESRPG